RFSRDWSSDVCSSDLLSGHPGIHFRYQLSGFDDEWQQVGNERQAVYHDLGPGDYVFRVRATNPDGVLSPEEATVRFSIPPAFYKIGRASCREGVQARS